MTQDPDPAVVATPAARSGYLGLTLKLVLVAAVIGGTHVVGQEVLAGLGAPLVPSTEPMLHRTAMVAIAVYVVLMMLPFVPGIEIGLALIALLGLDIVPLVYGATVVALTGAFLLGRLVPHATIVQILALLRLRRASELLTRLEPLETDQRLEFLLQRASSRVVPFLLRHRFLAIAIALNLPGNALVGGGGGICLIAGFSRLFPLPTFLAAVAVAVSPLPFFLLLTSLVG
jgi:hypothetical protein